MIRVYHNKNFMNYLIANLVNNPSTVLHNTQMIFAAFVKTDDLQEAFQLTNSIDCNWVDNPECIPTGLSGRSTSVGDLLETEDKKIYVVESLGFREVTPEDLQGVTCLDLFTRRF